MSPAQNDGFGRMTHYSRAAPPICTEYRADGYYWSLPIHTSNGGNTKWVGPFATRSDAKKGEPT